MNTEEVQATIDIVKSNMSPLIESLKDVGSIGWDLLVKKHFLVDGIARLLLILLPIIIIGFMLKKYNKEWSDDAKILSWIIIIMSLSSIIIISSFAVPNILLPEYYAIMDLIKPLK